MIVIKLRSFHVFPLMAHTLLVNYLTTLFEKKTKVQVNEKLTHTIVDYYEEEAKNDLNMRITIDELKQAIKKTKTNNKGADPYGLHIKLSKKIKFNTIGIVCT